MARPPSKIPGARPKKSAGNSSEPQEREPAPVSEPPPPPPLAIAASQPLNDNNVTHPIFGELPVATVWVYRIFRDKNGAEVRRIVLSGGNPREFVSEGQVLASWGPGRYRVIGRDTQNRIQGAPILLEFEDASGRVPISAEDEAALNTNAPPTVASTDKAFADRAIELMKLEATAAEKRQEREAAHYASMSSELIKTLGAGRGEGEPVVVTILRDRVRSLEDDCRELRAKVDTLREENTKQRIKIETTDLEFKTVAVRALEPHVGPLVNALVGIGMMILPESKRRALGLETPTTPGQLPAAPSSSPAALPEGAPLAGMRVPTVASLRKILDAGHAIPGEILTFCRQLHQQNLLPPDVWTLVQPFVDLAVAAAAS